MSVSSVGYVFLETSSFTDKRIFCSVFGNDEKQSISARSTGVEIYCNVRSTRLD